MEGGDGAIGAEVAGSTEVPQREASARVVSHVFAVPKDTASDEYRPVSEARVRAVLSELGLRG